MNMIASRPAPFAVLVSDSSTPCGVEAFARRLAQTAGRRAVTPVLDFNMAGLVRAIDGCRALVINLPIVAWKRRVIEPALAIAAARARGLRIVLVLHEWADLDWKRRVAYMPLIEAAHTVLFSCPEVEAQFNHRVALDRHDRRQGLVPIPPNLARPAVVRKTRLSDAIALQRERGHFSLGHFGSIYPKKQSTVVLDVAAAMLARGEDPFVVFVGSFIKGVDRVQQDFEAHVRRLGLGDRVLVTGYVESEADLFGIFEEIEVFAYSFPEGLTARRASVYACLTSGQPVVVNAPREADGFDHHPDYRRLLDEGLLRLVPHQASPDAIAEAVMAARHDHGSAVSVDVEAAWRSALRAVDAAASL